MHRTSNLSKRGLLPLLAISIALLAAACVTPPPSTGGGTTTTTTSSATKTLTNASFEWTISREADHGTPAPGLVNYWSAGQSDGTEGTYNPTNGGATVLKKNASGTYVPIKSEASVNWVNRTKNGAGATVSGSSATYLGQKIRYTGGTGTVNTTTGASTIQWTGTFTVNFYGGTVPFWIVNPKLTVSAAGVGRLTATLGGIGSSQDDPNIHVPLTPVPNVVVADFPVVNGKNTTGFTAASAYIGKAVSAPASAPQVIKTATNQAYWGAWPQSFVNFQNNTGLGSYFYTSGGASDPLKVAEPFTVAYNLAP